MPKTFSFPAGYTDARARAAMLPEIDVPNRNLVNSALYIVVDWNSSALMTFGGFTSLSWGSGLLKNPATGATVYNWSTSTFTPAQIFSGTITNSTLTVSRVVVTDGSKILTSSATTATELGYVNGVTSAIQTQLNAKAPTASPTFSGTITTPLTASRALVTGASSELAVSATTATELGYVSGVTSAIQTQLNAVTFGKILALVNFRPGI